MLFYRIMWRTHVDHAPEPGVMAVGAEGQDHVARDPVPRRSMSDLRPHHLRRRDRRGVHWRWLAVAPLDDAQFGADTTAFLIVIKRPVREELRRTGGHVQLANSLRHLAAVGDAAALQRLL